MDTALLLGVDGEQHLILHQPGCDGASAWQDGPADSMPAHCRQSTSKTCPRHGGVAGRTGRQAQQQGSSPCSVPIKLQTDHILGQCRQDKQAQQQSAAQLTSELLWLEGAFDSAGPYLAGEQFSLVDAAIIPWFLRMFVLKKYRCMSCVPSSCIHRALYDQLSLSLSLSLSPHPLKIGG